METQIIIKRFEIINRMRNSTYSLKEFGILSGDLKV